MDPNALLSRFLDALGTGDRAEVAESLSALREWIAKGGFLPDDPRTRVAGSPRRQRGRASSLGKTETLTDTDFEEMKKRFPQHVTDDDRAFDFTTLLRMVENRIADDAALLQKQDSLLDHTRIDRP